MGVFPRIRAVADHAVLAEFGDTPSDAALAGVRHLDASLSRHPLPGGVESVPGFAALLVRFDPLVTDHAAVTLALQQRLQAPVVSAAPGRLHRAAVCHDADMAPDLDAVAKACGLTRGEVVDSHLAADYRVVIYGFAPGYAYLSGVPAALHLPRKPAARRAVPAGSVIIAGAQCLITTLTMPTGWWIIGRSDLRILRDDPNRPFLFDVGDRVQFHRVAALPGDPSVPGR